MPDDTYFFENHVTLTQLYAGLLQLRELFLDAKKKITEWRT